MGDKESTRDEKGLPDIQPRDYGTGIKMPVEAGPSGPPSFTYSIHVQPDPTKIETTSQVDMDSSRNENEKQVIEAREKEMKMEMIDGRPRDIYDRFTKSQKRRILGIVSYSAIIAPMTSSIFLPSIPQMSDQLHSSPEVINYTVAIFILVIGIAPVFWSPYAGFYGRRPIYLASMPIMVVASIGVALSGNVGGLTGARIVQGIGGSCFLSVGAGSIGDIYRPTERSTGMSLFYMVTLLGPALSPAIAGIFTEYTPAGWRSCQYFLAGCGALSIFLVFFFLPETSHPPLPHETLKREKGKKFVWYICNPLSSLGLLRWPNILVACFISSCGMIDTYCVLVPLSSVFKERYHINNLAISGCLYLANGAGNILGSKIIGPWADKTVIKYIAKRGYRRPEDRLRSALLGIGVIMPLSNLAYGWLLQYGAGGIAAPLVMVFLNGIALMFGFAPLNTYLVDAMQTRSAEVIAVNNCIRYIFAAGASACILPIANAIGWGLTMTICTILTWIAALALYLLYKYGDKWRENANRRYGITARQADEERVEGGKDEESAVVDHTHQSMIERKDEVNAATEQGGSGLDLERSRSTPKAKIAEGKSSTHKTDDGLKRKSTRDLPNVEQVLKRTVSLSGQSVHGGG
uniref:Dityrosine transporter n=1 Tax=Kwoniella bestiolae CBS 10118 TaxID=1296100 RepID=A0A1B9GGT6_9TREE|nr:dityrosine transporter [Kwoniella bestiolae CBS 10118]OCF30187.1 dityrosine transporter [Kwoniella bestiolae CBS 10118]